ncbi:MAG TPA: UDP-glucose 4-epimerase GalE [Caulobacteraceae bacterium]|nr:UDP-glucose 4-epimerase GalE [Caulobacteraceae bacterium]
MTVLVTGGAGYIGVHAALALLDAGEKVVVLDDLSTGFAAAVPESAVLVEGDIGDIGLVRAALADHRVDAVMHFAAKTVVPESVADPSPYWRTNANKVARLLQAMRDEGVGELVFSSTAAVYGDVSDKPVAEDAPTRPVSPYGRSKLAAEWLIEDCGRAYGLAYANLRYFNVAGADPRRRAGQSTAAATHLIKAACQAVLGKRGALQVFGTDYPTPDGTGVRDYIQVSDLADAHLAALTHLRTGGKNLTLNAGYGRGYSVREVIAAVGRVAGQTVPTKEAPRRPGDPASIVADVSRIRGTLDWRPRFDDLDQIVAQALAWERQL